MKIKVSEASGAVLDWMVAKCEGYQAEGRVFLYGEPSKHVRIANQCGMEHTHHYSFEALFSTDWAQGGPIIERAGISLTQQAHEPGLWWASFCGALDFGQHNNAQYATTPLIAAMRCYVSSRLGDDVEVPDELA